MIPLVAAWISLLISGPVFAQIAWKSEEFRIEAEPGVPSIEGAFEFRNLGPVPVRVEKLKAACGCTAVAAEPGPVGPGATGVIRVTFKPGDRRGWYETAIAATVGGQTTKLRFVAGLIPAVDLSPTVLLWKKGGGADPRTATLERARGPRIRSVIVAGKPEGFLVEATEEVSGNRWAVAAKPAPGARRAVTEVVATLEDGSERRWKIHLRDQR